MLICLRPMKARNERNPLGTQQVSISKIGAGPGTQDSNAGRVNGCAWYC